MKIVGIFFIIGWIMRIVVLLVIAFIGFGAIAFISNDSEPPLPDKAQYGIQTYSDDGLRIPSRIYFTDDIIYDGSTPKIDDYWWFDGESYKHVKKERVFNEPFTVVRRTN